MKIAVIGGGIAGITAGIALQNRGFEFDVFEQAPEFKEIGAVLGVLPNGMEVLHSFGLADEIIEKGGVFNEFRVNSPSGKMIRNSFFNYRLPAVIIRRSDLHFALLSKIQKSSLFSNYQLVGYELTESKKVLLSFSNGEKLIYDAIIGADGIHSTVRKKIVGDNKPIYRGYNLWRGVGTVSNLPEYSCETWGPGIRFGFYPLHGNFVGWWASIVEEMNEKDDPPGIKEKLLSRFGNWHAPIPELIQNTNHIIKNHISDRKPIKKWFSEKAVLIGDAAHCTTPNLGQGANMAMESALLLARYFEKYGVNENAFSKFEHAQFYRTKNINLQSLMIGNMSQISNPIAISIRNFILRNLPYNLATQTYDKHYSYNVNTTELL